MPADASAAAWLEAALGPFGTVGGLVPDGFQEHLLLDHRGEDAFGWDGIAARFTCALPPCERRPVGFARWRLNRRREPRTRQPCRWRWAGRPIVP